MDNLMGKRSPNRVSAGLTMLRVGAQAQSASQGTTALLFTVDFQDSRLEAQSNGVCEIYPHESA